MKKNKLRYFTVLSVACMIMLASLTLGGCAKDKENSMISAKDLKHYSYVLESVDGQKFSSEFATPSLSFDDELMIFGRVCNNFRGQAQLKDNILKVEQMASTMMICPEQQLNDLERDFSQMLQAGAEISQQEGKLTLRQGGRELTYKLRDQAS